MAEAKRNWKQRTVLVARWLLPQPLLFGLWRLRPNRMQRPSSEVVSDRRLFRPEPGVVLEVFWVRLRGVGRGPSASLYVLDEEVMRLDCFGETDGHMHLNPAHWRVISGLKTPRLYFGASSIAEQIERSGFELTRNAAAALETNMLGRVRAFKIDPIALAGAVEDVMREMRLLYERRGDEPWPDANP
jgi:hypothetical protein